jgi:hypothetical protein
MAMAIQSGESREFTVPWDITKADARTLQLQLAKERSGGTFKVEIIGDRKVLVTGTEPTGQFTITQHTSSLAELDRQLRTRHIERSERPNYRRYY